MNIPNVKIDFHKLLRDVGRRSVCYDHLMLVFVDGVLVRKLTWATAEGAPDIPAHVRPIVDAYQGIRDLCEALKVGERP